MKWKHLHIHQKWKNKRFFFLKTEMFYRVDKFSNLNVILEKKNPNFY